MGELGGLTIGGRSEEGINIGRLETDSLPELTPLLGVVVTASPGCPAGVLLGITLAGGVVARRVVLSIGSLADGSCAELSGLAAMLCLTSPRLVAIASGNGASPI